MHTYPHTHSTYKHTPPLTDTHVRLCCTVQERVCTELKQEQRGLGWRLPYQGPKAPTGQGARPQLPRGAHLPPEGAGDEHSHFTAGITEARRSQEAARAAQWGGPRSSPPCPAVPQRDAGRAPSRRRRRRRQPVPLSAWCMPPRPLNSSSARSGSIPARRFRCRRQRPSGLPRRAGASVPPPPGPRGLRSGSRSAPAPGMGHCCSGPPGARAGLPGGAHAGFAVGKSVPARGSGQPAARFCSRSFIVQPPLKTTISNRVPWQGREEGSQ